MSDSIPTKRFRRTKLSVERDLFNAATRVVAEVGFSKLTVSRLIKEAKCDPPIFYLRYNDMSEFIDKFVRTYDYWLNDSIKIDYKADAAVENIEKIAIDLIDQLLDNICMQKLIAWEMNEDNFITRRTSQNRDNNSESMIKYFEEEFKNLDLNFNASTAIILGGIYYLVIHRKMGTFCNVDFSEPDSIALLKESVRDIIRKIFNDNCSTAVHIDKCRLDIATELVKNGVSFDIIERSTGISQLELSSLGIK